MDELLRRPVSDLPLSERPRSALRCLGVETIADLISRTPAQLLAAPDFGHKCLAEVVDALDLHGLALRRSD